MSRRVLASFFAAASLAVAAGPALAASPMAPVPMWSGFYVGLHGGYGKGSDEGCGTWNAGSLPVACAPLFAPPNNHDYSIQGPFDGGLAGVQVGDNFQLGSLVVGGELSASLGDLSHRNVAINIYEKLNPLFTATVHAGFASNNSFFYGLVGYAAGHQSHTDNQSSCYWDVDLNGLVYGAGVQTMITSKVSLFGEWNHLAFNEVNTSCHQTAGNVYTNNIIKTTGDVFKAGFNFHIN
jgi:outer membrane immunogenic protein